MTAFNMTAFERLVLRALGALLYCVMWRDNELMLRQGDEARRALINELRDAVQ